jgi:hypothetical protein
MRLLGTPLQIPELAIVSVSMLGPTVAVHLEANPPLANASEERGEACSGR